MKALMFSGQGSQYVGMCKELYTTFDCVKAVFKQASDILGYSVSEIMFNDEDKLNDTLYTQIMMFVMYQSILKILEENHIVIDTSLGLSLGEYGAMLHNQVFDFETGLQIVNQRSIAMAKAAQNHPGKMCAVIGMPEDTLNSILENLDGYSTIANYNTPNQLVISGETKIITHLSETLIDLGARRAILLNTSGAFHSKLMEQASKDFLAYLDKVPLKEPKYKLLINTTGDYYKKNLKDEMAKQITHSVHFYQSIHQLIAEGYDTFIEIGPKRTLCSFIKKIDRSKTVLNIEDLKSLENTLNVLGG